MFSPRLARRFIVFLCGICPIFCVGCGTESVQTQSQELSSSDNAAPDKAVVIEWRGIDTGYQHKSTVVLREGETLLQESEDGRSE
jgi:hypothetical protein